MAMGPDEMVDLESIKIGTNKRSAASAEKDSSLADGRTKRKPSACEEAALEGILLR